MSMSTWQNRVSRWNVYSPPLSLPCPKKLLPQWSNLDASGSQSTDDLKGSSINKVLRMWLSNYCLFGTFVTKMSNKYRDILQITDPNVIHAKFDAVPQERALQATAEENMALDQLGTSQGSIAEANSEAIDLSTFKAKANIRSALTLVDEAKVALDELGHAAKSMRRHLRRTTKALKSARDHTQTAFLANAGVKYSSIATVDIGARAVQSGLRTLRAQALRMGTCAQGHQTEL